MNCCDCHRHPSTHLAPKPSGAIFSSPQKKAPSASGAIVAQGSATNLKTLRNRCGSNLGILRRTPPKPYRVICPCIQPLKNSGAILAQAQSQPIQNQLRSTNIPNPPQPQPIQNHLRSTNLPNPPPPPEPFCLMPWQPTSKPSPTHVGPNNQHQKPSRAREPSNRPQHPRPHQPSRAISAPPAPTPQTSP